jgi:hypothetical protein
MITNLVLAAKIEDLLVSQMFYSYETGIGVGEVELISKIWMKLYKENQRNDSD